MEFPKTCDNVSKLLSIGEEITTPNELKNLFSATCTISFASVKVADHSNLKKLLQAFFSQKLKTSLSSEISEGHFIYF